ncbi:MAG: hypothetical protein P1P84_00995 [Deferrisomatales bacterium]|nr:hypothetical protein [Deferrisomatales bacterium]
MAVTLPLTWLLTASLLAAGCSENSSFPPRTRVGTVPEGFSLRPVSSAEDAAAYVDGYARALGVQDVRAAQVLGFGNVYWVYVTERNTDRPAFSLKVGADGAIGIRPFPAMAPEMMWNQKYGHEARPNPAMIEKSAPPAKAGKRLRQALPANGEVRPGEASAYYGYFLFPLCEGDRLVGEAAVNAADGVVTWKRFPEPPRSLWVAAGAKGPTCE